MTSIKTKIVGRAGIVTLDRPEALNALTHSMVRDLSTALDAFECEPMVEVVVVRSSSAKAFCAGGDVRHIRDLVLLQKYTEAEAFFADEYRLNARIASYPKPYVSLIDGVAMGGGLGISVHGRYRVVTERAVLAMPETAIGFFPDVGATYFLPRLTGDVGLWMGLTGAKVTGPQAVVCGLATHFVETGTLPALLDDLAHGQAWIESTIETRSRPASDPQFEAKCLAINAIFSANRVADIFNVAEILARLETETIEGSIQWLSALRKASPFSLAATFDLMQLGKSSTLQICLARELERAVEFIRHPDFAEGVRAMLVDKDRQPRWQPCSTPYYPPRSEDSSPKLAAK